MIDPNEARIFIDYFVEAADPVWTALSRARWNLATTGEERYKEEVVERRRQEHKLYEDESDWRRIREFYENRHSFEPTLRREVEVLHRYFLNNQSTAQESEAIARLEADINDIFINHRAEVNGQRLSDNEIADILQHSTSESERQQAWLGSKEVGAKAAELVRELAHRRNEIARRLGFRDHYAFALHRQEIDEQELFALFDHLAELTEEPFCRAREEVDRRLRQRLGLPDSQPLMPWHYADPFFQEAPPVFDANLDGLFANVDVAALSVRAYDGMGLEVRDILERSDLYEREGKDQHAFCTRIGRQGDTRILCNLRPNSRWMTTQMHELGHAVYNKYLPMELPYLLRTPAHTNSTEAIAMLMGRLPFNPQWLEAVAGQDGSALRPLQSELELEMATAQLIFVRWVLVMLHFERAFYADPDRSDLDDLWWQLAGRYQLLTRPEGRDEPDWAAKYHIALAPVYYHNYVLGELTASQLERWIIEEAGGLVDAPQAGSMLVDHFFVHGARLKWNELVEAATGEPLDPAHFVRQFVS